MLWRPEGTPRAVPLGGSPFSVPGADPPGQRIRTHPAAPCAGPRRPAPSEVRRSPYLAPTHQGRGFERTRLRRVPALFGATSSGASASPLGGSNTSLCSNQENGGLRPPFSWSGREDSNLRPSAPKADALPGCATPRRSGSIANGRGSPSGYLPQVSMQHSLSPALGGKAGVIEPLVWPSLKPAALTSDP